MDFKIIVGNWELRKEVGGIAGTIDYPPGNGTIYSFTSGGKYKLRYKGVTSDSGAYTLKPIALTHNWYLKFNSTRNNYDWVDSVTINGNQLIFFPRIVCCDAPTITYERISH